MSEKVRVWNRGSEDYTEEFKGKKVTVPAGKFIEMEIFEAAEFKGKYPGKGVIKMIKIERLSNKTTKSPEPQVCNLCAKTFPSERTLFEHLKTHQPAEVEPKRTRKKAEVVDDSSANTGNDTGAN